ncbi:MAG: HlyD family efflux transporter periplasmic adaptor subunit [Candidatus Zixiibacteriota bacterium]|nr:MAG: HlyD family efflux transporter periplasmic adaptor subunit [candidate division Zixibacteria bacterium]
MDRALPADIIRKKRLKRYLKIASVVLILLVVYIVFRTIMTPTISRGKILTSVAEVGTIEATITASGVVTPEFEQVLTSPIPSKIENIILKSGDPVKAGQSILKLNKEFIQIEYEKLTDELALLKNKKEQLGLRLQRTRIDLQARYDIKDLETKFMTAQLERATRLYEIGGGTQQDLERAELSLEIAQRELKQLANQMENQQASLEADLNELNFQIQIQKNSIGEVRRQMELADARADRNGVITWINDDLGATVNPGDALARIADLGSFKVEARISDIHASRLKVGGPVKVRINDLDLAGRISNIFPTVENGIVTFVAELDEKSHVSLRSNLRVDVFVITSCKDSVIRVGNGAFYEGSVDQKVFVVEGDEAVRRVVSIGASNYDYVEIRGDIRPGDEVIISDMSNYYHMERVGIAED